VSPTPPETLRHAYPFKLAERMERTDDGTVAIVLATADGELTRGVALPASLVFEALAQSILLVEPPPAGGALRLVGIDGARVLQPLGAGDRVEVAVTGLGSFGALRRYACRAVSGGALAAVAEFTVSG
jgi:3-hydroxymyristoyl/3-hydroxydecanoyl-(acyl carrier protein) dehydratase